MASKAAKLITRHLRVLWTGRADWQQRIRLYHEVCPHLTLLSPRHQYSCLKKIQERLWWDPLFILGALICGGPPIIAYVCCLSSLGPGVCGSFWSIPVFVFLLGPLVFQPVADRWVRWIAPRLMPNRFRRIVRACVNDYSDLKVCTECGYDLRGQTVPRCPECGRAMPELREKSRRRSRQRSSTVPDSEHLKPPLNH